MMAATNLIYSFSSIIVPKYVSTKVHGLQQLKDNVEHNLSLKLLGRKLEIVTSLNKDFIADTHTTEFVEGDGTVKKYAGVLGAYSFGVVKDDPHSHVSFHHTAKGIVSAINSLFYRYPHFN